jgi:hypothetical protein
MQSDYTVFLNTNADHCLHRLRFQFMYEWLPVMRRLVLCIASTVILAHLKTVLCVVDIPATRLSRDLDFNTRWRLGASCAWVLECTLNHVCTSILAHKKGVCLSKWGPFSELVLYAGKRINGCNRPVNKWQEEQGNSNALQF